MNNLLHKLDSCHEFQLVWSENDNGQNSQKHHVQTQEEIRRKRGEMNYLQCYPKQSYTLLKLSWS